MRITPSINACYVKLIAAFVSYESFYQTSQLSIIRHSKRGKFSFGAWVEIENEEGEVMNFRIVGPEEIYGDAKGYISIDSPMARALLKKEVDDEFVVRTPEGEKEWFINSIRYEKPSE